MSGIISFSSVPSQMRELLFVLGAVLSACGPSCPAREASAAGPHGTVNASDLGPSELMPKAEALQLRIAPSEYVGPAPAYIDITLRNVSDGDLWVNRRLLVGPKGGRDQEVWLDITDSATGKEIERGACAGKGVPKGLHDYIVLSPWSEYTSVERLSCYSFSGSERWRIVAHYHDQRSDPPRPPAGSRWFTGSATSEPIEVQLGSRKADSAP